MFTPDGFWRDDGAMRRRTEPRWNHNIHFHGVVLAAIPTGAQSALDVGTGDGMLAVDLRQTLSDVVAIDVDATVLSKAAARHPDISWVEGDVMTYDFGRTFDVVASVATVHHLPDLRDGLQRLADLTGPGGTLVIVGLARPSTARDYILSAVGSVQDQWLSRTAERVGALRPRRLAAAAHLPGGPARRDRRAAGSALAAVPVVALCADMAPAVTEPPLVFGSDLSLL